MNAKSTLVGFLWVYLLYFLKSSKIGTIQSCADERDLNAPNIVIAIIYIINLSSQ